ncbi:MAG: S-adenosylmethionine synthase [Candidatus Uhrbacteria bacterium GW2011_GWD2_41_121]|uniref:S-adenosylmethionine synthase n=1 Tax=Candidatus Uhrbacteria bacterium GW2011_GWC1_41_20 TaxID=1618983 RepID=A0A0G0VEB3_9BACT|nr:MAG: S-adenosylmethionine synthase [Candidatus Uhrbacteria bacterium GW2011_GWE1_39_46]KKR63897.1 MAG: S-adenosylmethionine synthase [Candidatus Uhrbacteria bacterium GW2011_GWC2_40_450]KKR89669.1 MAG: S-adenosylmethionine synthase [Candidatus Uhrbacteria bacterium GW2011_GWE2_41_1153]KKR90191.1 MAG: S-adenosylmethionine synthase [Candidatus Uhrbacteria bacterium GW2011_GWD2_41_121]KKR96106.1 MAG: S-adenosylmethionine synthase [Candidatus Uhrbacteria bacterium GW2011_GWD1_41_16]KKR99189.1 M
MLKTVEVPLSGHPDKVCDQIVEGLLDEYLRRDPKSRISLKACGSHGMLMIGGTVDSRADFDASALARKIYTEIGYVDDIEPFVNIERPSENLAKTIINGGAQGSTAVHGYATKETREFLPRAYVYANAIARRIDDLRCHNEAFSFLLPDGKVQITMDANKIVVVTVSVQHDNSVDRNVVQTSILDHVIFPILGDTSGIKIFINSAGDFSEGGFYASAGASGLKVLADTYGGLLPHSGASFTGRDPLQPARAGMLMARYVAKNLVAQGVAGNIFITAGYAIGHHDPIFLQAMSGKGEDLTSIVKDKYDFRPEAIVERLNLRQPFYQRMSVHGCFGKEGAPWEEIGE